LPALTVRFSQTSILSEFQWADSNTVVLHCTSTAAEVDDDLYLARPCVQGVLHEPEDYVGEGGYGGG